MATSRRRWIIWAPVTVLLVIALPFLLYLNGWTEFTLTKTSYAETVLRLQGMLERFIRAII